MSALELLTQGDAVSRAVAALLLAMSVASWVVILWKAWLLRGGTRDVLRSIAAFWQSPGLDEAAQRLQGFDRAALVRPAVLALQQVALDAQAGRGDLASQGGLAQRLTRALRDALHGALRRLQAGQILLATVGATAPFVGLLGTVWGIHRALATIAVQTGGFTIDKVAGPVGEALIMTGIGLAVALPAVMGYNWLTRSNRVLTAKLDAFAFELLTFLSMGRALQAGRARAGVPLTAVN